MNAARLRCQVDRRVSPSSRAVRTASVHRFPSIPPTARGIWDTRIRNALDDSDRLRGTRRTVPQWADRKSSRHRENHSLHGNGKRKVACRRKHKKSCPETVSTPA
jgi:hypothetical protein